ncbi:MAG: hypothetical protein HC853_10215, partial [Anaerolineae bacterium]|nr:hypothetical protein [Anaerolineae bacterium]
MSMVAQSVSASATDWARNGIHPAIITGSVTAVGTVTEINAALSGLRFTPTPDSNGSTSIGIAVSDLGNSAHPDNAAVGTANANVTINITAINDAPVLTVPG